MIKAASDFVTEAKAECTCLNAEDALNLSKTLDDVLIIDVREPHEAAEAKIVDAVNIPRGLLEMKVTQHCSDPSTTILVHCAGGGRASLAALRLQEMGYRNVYPITDTFTDISDTFGTE